METNEFHLFSPAGIILSAGIFVSFCILYTVGTAVYNIWFHPLSHIPGPKLSSASAIPHIIHTRNGTNVNRIKQLHEKYGDVVRVAPTELSFISGESAWQDIYGFRTGKHKTPPYLKDRNWYPIPVNGVYSVIVADEEGHSRMRRNLSHAFSERALKEQEGLIQSLINLFIQRLHEEVEEGRPAVDIMRWYNYATFDIIADLTFGESLHCLRDKGYHPWVNLVFSSIKATPLVAGRRRYPMLDYYERFIGMFGESNTNEAVRKRIEFFRVAASKVSARLESEGDRPDFMSHIIKNQATEAKALTREELDSNAVVFLVAGSETTATLLSGVTYLLLRNPDTYAKLVHEIRTRFHHYDDITIDAANRCEYMIAVLQEALRYYPPVATGFPRVVPAGGDTISGRYIPQGTSVYMSQHAANHSSRNWTDPERFAPERWLGHERYKDDNRASLNPFSFGPRNCLGKNLAFAEMRVILAKIIFSFDMELQDKELDWIRVQKVFALWEKPALNVKLTPVQR